MAQLDNEDELEVAKKLGDISLVMSDACYFMQARSLVETWVRLAKNGDPIAQSAMSMVNQFHNFCTYVLKQNKE